MIVAFKAFDQDLSCTSGGNKYQYSKHGWNEEPEANCAKNGFHCAADPLDCLIYYPNWDKAVYYMVLAAGDLNEDGRDSKISCTKMKLVKRLTKEEFVWSAMNYMAEHPYTCRVKSPDFGQREKMFRSNGILIVRGKDPIVTGTVGEVIGIAKEYTDSPEIESMSIFIIDGKIFREDTPYRVDGVLINDEE